MSLGREIGFVVQVPDPFLDCRLVEDVDGPDHEVAEPDGEDDERHGRDERRTRRRHLLLIAGFQFCKAKNGSSDDWKKHCDQLMGGNPVLVVMGGDS